MPWQELSIMSQRLEFIRLARQETISLRELCRRFSISAPTAYKWLNRFEDGSLDCEASVLDLRDHSRRPHNSPNKTTDALEAAVLALRQDHPTWGGRKLAARLSALGHTDVPAPSTITEILRRHNALGSAQGSQARAPLRFEHEQPNDLWQMDFKGHFAIEGGRCHPLTILDDH